MSNEKQSPNEDWRGAEGVMGGIFACLGIIAVLVLFGFELKNSSLFNSPDPEEDAVKVWEVSQTTYLKSLNKSEAENTHVENKSHGLGGNQFIVNVSSQNVYQYIYKTSDGGYRTGSVPSDNVTVYEKAGEKKPRIVVEKCFLKDKQKSDKKKNVNEVKPYKQHSFNGKSCGEYFDEPDERTKIYVPEGSVSNDISVNP